MSTPKVPQAAEDVRPLRVWPDDVRPLRDDSWTPTVTVEETIALLEHHVVLNLSLDNDLGGHLAKGWTVARWMTESGLWPTRTVAVHSSNQPRRARMTDLFEATGIFQQVPGRLGTYAAMNDVFGIYRTTDVVIATETGPVTSPYDGQVPSELEVLLPIHVLTASSPLSVDPDPGWNSAADERLGAAVADAGGATVLPCAGVGRDGLHELERSFAVAGITRQVAVDLGRRFGQQAIFTIDRRGLHVVPCAVVGRQHGELHFRPAFFARTGRIDEFVAAFDGLRGGTADAEALIAEVDPSTADPAWVAVVVAGAASAVVSA